MAAELDLWRIAAGLGLFLFGMHQLEAALKQLAGRSFKRFLRQYTAKPIRGVLAGAATTAALQSSSVVSLIVLAFVGTGVITLASAIGIVFGSNLGTTATGWIVATVGFKLDDATAVATMNTCASGADKAYEAKNGAELRQAFRDIAEQITRLRLSRHGPGARSLRFDGATAPRMFSSVVVLARTQR